LRGLAEEPKDRFPSVRDFMAALDRGLSSPPWWSRTPPLALAAAFIVLCSAAGRAWVLGRGAGPRHGVEPVGAPPGPSGPVETKDGSAPNPARTPPAKGASGSPARPPGRSREFRRLVELRAYVIWDRSGRPEGAAGDAVEKKNWLEAERQIG